MPWVVAGVSVVVALLAVGLLAGRDNTDRRTAQQREVHDSVEDAVDDTLEKDAVVARDDEDRELKVTSPTLRQPFTVSIPKGFEARLSGKKVTAVSEFAAIVTARPRAGFATNYLIEVPTLQGDDDLEKMAAAAISSNAGLGLPEFRAVGGPVSTRVGSRPAIQRDYSFLQDGRRLNGRLVVTLVGDQPVLFYLTALERDFEAHEEGFATFLASARGN